SAEIEELAGLYKEAAAEFRSRILDREEAEARRLRKEREMEERAEAAEEMLKAAEERAKAERAGREAAEEMLKAAAKREE
ncbi:hypothetical protein C0995_005604, partial [Termitomyces sp. Mi166